MEPLQNSIWRDSLANLMQNSDIAYGRSRFFGTEKIHPATIIFLLFSSPTFLFHPIFMPSPLRCETVKLTDMIYLDNNATTEVDPEVVKEMLPFLTTHYGNPSSPYHFGKQAAEALGLARERLASFLGCAARELIFTSCGTEANNAAILSALQVNPDRRHIVTTAIEHSSIIKLCETLSRKGYGVSYVPVDARGQVDLQALSDAIRQDTAIVSAMWANNETGTVLPIPEIAKIASEKNVLFHTDAVQVIGKMPVNLSEMGVHFLSLSGHKLHAPKGIGALYINRRTRFIPMLPGSQESGKRAGTENVAGIVALGKAAELAGKYIDIELSEVKAMRDRFESEIFQRVSGVQMNGDPENRLPNTVNFSFHGVEGEGLLMMLDRRGICCSTGSACTTGALAPSHVLKAMGLSNSAARGSLRFSFSRMNAKGDVDVVFEALSEVVETLRTLSATPEKVARQAVAL